jgi:glucuronoarabinoxylan endo-1,4-beta-xylanase
MNKQARTRVVGTLATLALTLVCGTMRADLVGGTFTNGTVNPTNWDKVGGIAPFYTSFPATNNLSAVANIQQTPPAPAPVAQFVLLSETITPRTANWVLTGLAILAGGAPAGQLSLHIFDVTATLTSTSGSYSNSSGAYYTLTNGDLLGAGNGLTYSQPGAGSGNANQEIFIFTNGPASTDQIVLGKNRQYAVEVWAPATNASEIDWLRTAGTTPVDANAGGQAMSGYDPGGTPQAQRLTLVGNGQAGSAPRTFALALYGSSTIAQFTVNTNPPIISPGPQITNGVCTVDWNDVHQRIDGFGASSAWRSSWSTAQADILFSTNNGIVYTDNLSQKSTNNGIGLSLLRNHIVPAGSTSPADTPTTVETSIMQMARDRGARVWSSPWTPAIGFKNTNDLYDSNHALFGGTNGGSFWGGDATNRAYASQLANYVASMTNTYKVSLYAISIQNEPDANVTNYEACQWTNTAIHDFVTNLYNAMLALNVTSTLIMLPEAQNWQDPKNLAVNAMTDSVVAADVGIVANHNYDGWYGPATLTKNSYGKPLWETEVSLLSGSDSSIVNGVYYAYRIHQFMTVAQANAWHYWWLISGAGGNQGLMDNNAAITKRLFTVGNFSRFVRPNYYRIGATNTGNAFISAYKDSNSPAFAIVAVNANGYPVEQTFSLTNFTSGSVTPWVTSSNLSLAPLSTFAFTNEIFLYELPAMSVVTFVGLGAANSAPTLTPVANQVINAGYPLQATNFATDPDWPSQSLTFSLLSSPANATLTPLNGTNAVFAWRPLVSQAKTTNPVSVVVVDGGSPGLSATNNFTVTVNPVTNPVFGSVTVTSGQVSLGVTNWGLQGPDYTLETTTNLVMTNGWQALYTVGSTNSPVTQMTDPNPTGPVRFYRIQIGP